jgi:hypothetical protein
MLNIYIYLQLKLLPTLCSPVAFCIFESLAEAHPLSLINIGAQQSLQTYVARKYLIQIVHRFGILVLSYNTGIAVVVKLFTSPQFMKR